MEKLLSELNKRTKQYHKIQYFCWRNGLDTRFCKYSTLTEEELRKKFKPVDEHWDFLVKWEKSLEYSEWYALYLQYKAKQDFIQMYEAVREKALKGDEKAIKLFLQLQKELKKINKNKDLADEEDISMQTDDADDLKLTIP